MGKRKALGDAVESEPGRRFEMNNICRKNAAGELTSVRLGPPL